MDEREFYSALQPRPLSAFGAAFASFSVCAFRLELLPLYDVTEGDERERFKAFIARQPLAPLANTEWQDIIRAARARGATMERRRVVPLTPTDYIRFEVLQYYGHNQEAGENIRIIVSDHLNPFSTIVPVYQDFWLFDHRLLFMMQYDILGRFLGILEAPGPQVAPYLALQQEALGKGVAFKDYQATLSAG